jgi:hypothetical protein
LRWFNDYCLFDGDTLAPKQVTFQKGNLVRDALLQTMKASRVVMLAMASRLLSVAAISPSKSSPERFPC